ncbi:class I SAM-dependent methyltransferase [Bosea sp. AAP35]|uniref:class I SAM-dependent methyltransferase n=1 Tax=Bosea sp. AAP35 TaxID=1523417 RepID=UPI0009E9A200|nr:class I SAM-dependent methyltransferase [Bosea sp. AAP35]
MTAPSFCARSEDDEQRSFIPLARPRSALPFDGERYTTAVTGRIEHEHLLRYLFARSFCGDCVVLDVASGEGYGAALLAQVARKVVGVDLSQEAVAHAQKAYASSNLSFCRGTCLSLPIASNSVDVVISFETIEHIEEHELLFSEFKRVMRRDGILIISTPDKIVYSQETGYDNPFHKRELTRHEFASVIKKNFSHSLFLGQNSGSVSIMAPISQYSCSPDIFFRSSENIVQDKVLSKPRFVVSVASDNALPAIAGSIFFEADTAKKYSADDEVRQALARAGELEGPVLREVFSMVTSLPKPGPRTGLERVQNDLVVTAHDEDPRLELPLAKTLSQWLIVRAVLVVEETCVAQVYFRSVREEAINPNFALYRKLEPGVNRLHLLLSAEAPINFIRFDPTDRPARIVIRDLAVLAPS